MKLLTHVTMRGVTIFVALAVASVCMLGDLVNCSGELAASSSNVSSRGVSTSLHSSTRSAGEALGESATLNDSLLDGDLGEVGPMNDEFSFQNFVQDPENRLVVGGIGILVAFGLAFVLFPVILGRSVPESKIAQLLGLPMEHPFATAIATLSTVGTIWFGHSKGYTAPAAYSFIRSKFPGGTTSKPGDGGNPDASEPDASESDGKSGEVALKGDNSAGAPEKEEADQ